MSTNNYGNIDVSFTFAPEVDKSILLETDIQAIAGYIQDVSLAEYGDLDVRIEYKTESGKYYIVCNTEVDSVIMDSSDFELGNAALTSLSVRIFIHNTCISVWVNERWVYSFALSFVNYSVDSIVAAQLSVHGTDGITLTNIIRRELSDWREAVFVDYEANAESVIQSIIQQRPLEILPEVENSITFTYRAIKDTIVPNFVTKYTEHELTPSDVSSDGLVYAADIGISLYDAAAEQVGFITRLYRLSELDSGTIKAARVMQEKALERRHPATIIMRLDPRIEYTDLIDLDLTVTGTQTILSREVITESISIFIENGRFSMNIGGRRNET